MQCLGNQAWTVLQYQLLVFLLGSVSLLHSEHCSEFSNLILCWFEVIVSVIYAWLSDQKKKSERQVWQWISPVFIDWRCLQKLREK